MPANASAAAILQALGPAHRHDAGGSRHRLEWFLAHDRGFLIEFEDPCRPPTLVRREAAHSVRRTELAARAGLWVVPEEQIADVDRRLAVLGKQYVVAPPPSFYYDGETLTLVLVPFFSLQAMAPNRPPDDVYRLATKWIDDDLWWLSPENPTWTALHSFRDGHFVADEGNGDFGVLHWRFERRSPERSTAAERALLLPRGRWNYGLERVAEPR